MFMACIVLYNYNPYLWFDVYVFTILEVFKVFCGWWILWPIAEDKRNNMGRLTTGHTFEQISPQKLIIYAKK